MTKQPITSAQWMYLTCSAVLGILLMWGVAWSMTGGPLHDWRWGWWWTSIVGATCGLSGAAWTLATRPN